MRRAIGADTVGPYQIPAGCDIYLNLFTLHRHPALWPDPDRFDPQRFTPEAAAGRARHVYQPFGSGPRHCIGKHFALTELHLATAMVAQSLHLSRVPDAPATGFRPHVTLHPDGGIRLRVRAR
jgi:cytochrome P450